MSVIENAAGAPRHVSFAIPAAAEYAGLARKMAEAVLHAWASPVDEFTTVLLLSEVFTNAILHGVASPNCGSSARIRVDLLETSTGLHVEVHDPDDGKRGSVVINHAAVQAESGRGLELVDELSAAWGCKYTPAGKFVYFDVDTAGDERGPAACAAEVTLCT